MSVNREAFRKLVDAVSEFYITDRQMKKAQDRIAGLIAADRLDNEAAAAYLDAVRTYFAAFEREARAHLRTVDKRLEHINQVHFNLTAERSVAVRRIEETRGVLDRLASV